MWAAKLGHLEAGFNSAGDETKTETGHDQVLQESLLPSGIDLARRDTAGLTARSPPPPPAPRCLVLGLS